MRRALILALVLMAPPVAWGATDVIRGAPGAEDLEREIASIESEIGEAADARRARGERLKARTRALYRLMRRPAVADGEGLSAVFAQHARTSRLSQMIRADIEALRLASERVDGLKNALEAKRAALVEERARLVEIEKRRKQLEDRARVFAGDLPGLGVAPVAPLVTQGGSIVVHDMEGSLALGFASMRGRLGAPVRGTFRVRDAVRDGGPGLEILVRAGAPVHSVADGRVAYTERDENHGRLVIVDHGDSYFTVFGGLSSVRARVGAFVAKGEAIGEADAAGIFFEVRRGAKSLDPRHWTGL